MENTEKIKKKVEEIKQRTEKVKGQKGEQKEGQ